MENRKLALQVAVEMAKPNDTVHDMLRNAGKILRFLEGAESTGLNDNPLRDEAIRSPTSDSAPKFPSALT